MIHLLRRTGRTLRRFPGSSAALLLVVTLLVVFAPIAVGGRTFQAAQSCPGVMPNGPYGLSQETVPSTHTFGNDPGGSGWQIVSETQKIRLEAEQGRVPLWNPNQMCGTPLLYNMQLSSLFPLRILPQLVSTVGAWDAYKLLLLLGAGFFTFVYLRLMGCLWLPAAVGGVAYMLTGFMVLHINFSFMDVQALAPLLLVLTEWLIQRPCPRRFALLSLAFGAAALCAYPVPVFLAVFTTACYAAYRLVSEWRDPASNRRQVAWGAGAFALAGILGAGLAAPALLPGIDLLLSTENARGPATGWLAHPPKYFFGAFFPDVLTTLRERYQWSGWQGLVATALAFAAARAGWRRRPTLFFLVFSLLCFFKLLGLPPVAWVSYLPFFDRINCTRYLQPQLALGVAVLAGLGAQALMKREVGLRCMLTFSGVLLGATALAALAQAGQVRGSTVAHLLGPVAALGALLFAMWRRTRPRRLGWALLALVLAELGVVALSLERNVRHDPFTPAPYVTFLQARTPRARVLGLDGILYPPYASAFDIDDVRWMNAVVSPHYARFIREFVSPQALDRYVGDEADQRVFADGGLTRYMRLAGVRYLITSSSFESRAFMQRAFETGTPAGRRPPVLGVYTLADEVRRTIRQNGPGTLEWDVDLPADPVILSCDVGLEPSARHGDGVEFRIHVDGVQRASLRLDPGSSVADRGWHPMRVDLSERRGKRVRLKLEVHPGPRGDRDHDRAHWGDLRLVPAAGEVGPTSRQHPRLALCYDAEVKIYEDPGALPRVLVLGQVTLAPDSDAMVARMKDSAYDPGREVVLESAAKEDLDRLGFASSVGGSVGHAKLVSYSANQIVVEARLDRAGVLRLGDSYYPNWVVAVDGAPARVYRADLTFRGVCLPPGEHRIVFTLVDPLFDLSLKIALACALAVAGCAAVALRAARSSPLPPTETPT